MYITIAKCINGKITTHMAYVQKRNKLDDIRNKIKNMPNVVAYWIFYNGRCYHATRDWKFKKFEEWCNEERIQSMDENVKDYVRIVGGYINS